MERPENRMGNLEATRRSQSMTASNSYTAKQIKEALEHVQGMCDFAYRQGFHELGYDPVQVLRDVLRDMPTPEHGEGWIACKDRLPPHARKVVAFLSGWKEHSGTTWAREGIAMMVRWDNEPLHTVADGWSAESYEKARKEIDFDSALVTHWLPIPERSTATHNDEGMA
jgi:hypothetical protein